MRRAKFVWVILLTAAISVFTAAQSNNNSSTDFQCSSVNTYTTGLNDAGQVVGWYSSSEVPFDGAQGFVRDKNGPCETLSGPAGAVATIPLGINDPGKIVGIYFSASKPNGSAFLYEKGIYTTFDYPATGVCQTFAFSINNRGQIVGLYDILRSENGQTVCDGPDKPFIRQPDGTFTTPSSPPSATDSVQLNGINARGMTIGNYLETCTAEPCHEYGFLRQSDGSFVMIAPVGAVDTMPTGVNAQGQVVGRYFTETWLEAIGPCYGFFRDTDGTISEIKYPGATFTCVGGIDAAGQVSGAWSGSLNGPWHGFVADLKLMMPSAQ